MMKDFGTNYQAFFDYGDMGLGYSFDLRFLMSYAEVTKNTSYSDFAKGYWAWKKDMSNNYKDGNQEQFYQYFVAHAGHGFAAWGTGDFGLAALAMEDTIWASAMAAVLAGHLGEISAEDECRFIGWGKALEFLNAVDSTLYATEITNLITNLTTNQNDDGSWGTGENTEGYAQDAAYAIMGLVAAGGANAIAAAEKGADWLVINQGYDGIEGGWNGSIDNIEYSETDSEALQAIKAVLDISGAVSMTATSETAVIGISVSPSTINFGAITSGDTVPGTQLTVSNLGNVSIVVDAEITADTRYNETGDALYFYTAALRLAGMPSDSMLLTPDPSILGAWPWEAPGIFGDYPIEVNGSRSLTTELQCPSLIKAGIEYTGTVTFWASQPEPMP